MMHKPKKRYHFKSGILVGVAAFLSLILTAVVAEQRSHDAPRGFQATTAKSFPQLMEDAMNIMHHDMESANVSGNPDHDFVTMMIPHHQGAVDMAKVLLLYGKDPALRALAQQIVTEQTSEIQLMHAWLRAHPNLQSRRPKE